MYFIESLQINLFMKKLIISALNVSAFFRIVHIYLQRAQKVTTNVQYYQLEQVLLIPCVTGKSCYNFYYYFYLSKNKVYDLTSGLSLLQ